MRLRGTGLNTNPIFSNSNLNHESIFEVWIWIQFESSYIYYGFKLAELEHFWNSSFQSAKFLPVEVAKYMSQQQDNSLSLFYHVKQKFSSVHHVQIVAVGWKGYFADKSKKFLKFFHLLFHRTILICIQSGYVNITKVPPQY